MFVAGAAQRHAMLDIETPKPPWPPVVLVTDSRLARGVMTAVGWFLPVQLHTFALADLESALDAASAHTTQSEIERLRRLVLRWQSEYQGR